MEQLLVAWRADVVAALLLFSECLKEGRLQHAALLELPTGLRHAQGFLPP